MALWPFRRKIRRKRTRINLKDVEEPRRCPIENLVLPARSETDLDTLMISNNGEILPQRRRSRQPASQGRSSRTRDSGNSSGRHDSNKLGRCKSRETVLPLSRLRNAGHNPGGPFHKKVGEAKVVDSWFSAPEDHPFSRPTLDNKRNGDRFSSEKLNKKRRRDDHEREAEIKAWSNFTPVRPATEDWKAGRPISKEIKRITSSLGLRLCGCKQKWEQEHRASFVSLPPPRSMDSAMSLADWDPITFRVSSLDGLMPRPTIRCSLDQRWTDPQVTRPYRRTSTRTNKLSQPIPETALRAHKRMHELADDLSASDLRELMERDRRRKERRTTLEQERIQRKFARRAERQLAADIEGRASPPNFVRGVLGRESVGLGNDPDSVVRTSSRRKEPDTEAASPKSLGKRPVAFPEGVVEEQSTEHEPVKPERRPSPLDDFHSTTSIVKEPQIFAADPEKQSLRTSKPHSLRESFLKKLSRPKSPPQAPVRQATSQILRKSSLRSWRSLFRLGRRRKVPDGPSSFSNTSRDSMLATHMPLLASPPNFMPRKISSGVPQRTRSRFREDLPELPRSPPDFHPDADLISTTKTEAYPNVGVAAPFATALLVLAQGTINDTPTSSFRSVEGLRKSPSTFGHNDELEIPSPQPQSMSLASIDSEGSWLSGRVSCKRQLRIVHANPNMRPRGESGSDKSHNSNESVIDDEYLSRHTPENPSWKRKSESDALASSDEDDARWGSVLHQPRVVSGILAQRAQSRLGTLNMFAEDEEPVAVEGTSIYLASSLVSSSLLDSSGLCSCPVALQRASVSITLDKPDGANVVSLTPRSSLDVRRAREDEACNGD